VTWFTQQVKWPKAVFESIGARTRAPGGTQSILTATIDRVCLTLIRYPASVERMNARGATDENTSYRTSRWDRVFVCDPDVVQSDPAFDSEAVVDTCVKSRPEVES
jgi:hypothetical protein